MYLKPLFLSLGLAGSSLVSAHYIVTEFSIEKVALEEAKCLRVGAKGFDQSFVSNTNPLLDVTSNDIACSEY